MAKENELTIDELGESTDQVFHLRKKIKDLQGQTDKLRRTLGEQTELAEMVAASVCSCDPFPARKFIPPTKKDTFIVPVLKLSDFHIGEVVNPAETEGLNAYNWAIAQKRLFGIVDDFLKWVEVQRHAYKIEECAVFGEGDYVSGDIHSELVATNEFTLPEQTAKAGLLLGEVLRMIAGHFKKLDVYLVGADNHGRLQKKPQAKQKAANNMSYLVHTLAIAYTEKCRNIKFTVAEGIKLLAEVNGLKVLSEHGDCVKGWSGLPFYGFQRTIGKEAKRRMLNGKGFHVWSIGHFHVPSFIEDTTILNGSLSGTSEFDHACGRYAKPCQLAYMVHPKHGVFNIVPFYGVD